MATVMPAHDSDDSPSPAPNSTPHQPPMQIQPASRPSFSTSVPFSPVTTVGSIPELIDLVSAFALDNGMHATLANMGLACQAWKTWTTAKLDQAKDSYFRWDTHCVKPWTPAQMAIVREVHHDEYLKHTHCILSPFQLVRECPNATALFFNFKNLAHSHLDPDLRAEIEASDSYPNIQHVEITCRAHVWEALPNLSQWAKLESLHLILRPSPDGTTLQGNLDSYHYNTLVIQHKYRNLPDLTVIQSASVADELACRKATAFVLEVDARCHDETKDGGGGRDVRLKADFVLKQVTGVARYELYGTSALDTALSWIEPNLQTIESLKITLTAKPRSPQTFWPKSELVRALLPATELCQEEFHILQTVMPRLSYMSFECYVQANCRDHTVAPALPPLRQIWGWKGTVDEEAIIDTAWFEEHENGKCKRDDGSDSSDEEEEDEEDDEEVDEEQQIDDNEEDDEQNEDDDDDDEADEEDGNGGEEDAEAPEIPNDQAAGQAAAPDGVGDIPAEQAGGEVVAVPMAPAEEQQQGDAGDETAEQISEQ